MYYGIDDRVPQNPNQWNMQKSDGSSENVTLTRADNPVVEGSPINEKTLMGVQGYVDSTTVFNPDGSITETNETGTTTTVFNADGSITETFVSNSQKTKIKTTTFESDGSIKEVLG